MLVGRGVTFARAVIFYKLEDPHEYRFLTYFPAVCLCVSFRISFTGYVLISSLTSLFFTFNLCDVRKKIKW